MIMKDEHKEFTGKNIKIISTIFVRNFEVV